MRKEFSIFAVGLIVGLGVMALWPEKGSETIALTNEADSPESEEVSENALALELKAAESKISQLEEALETARQAQPFVMNSKGDARASGSLTVIGNLKTDAKKGEFFVSHLGEMSNQRLKLLQRRLGLNEEQSAAFLEMFELKQESFRQMIENGGKENEYMKVTQNDLIDLAADILDEAQLAEYNRLIDEERRGRNEIMATARLNHLGPTLNLSEDQRDALYGIFYQEADLMNEGIGKDQFEIVREQTDKSIRSILSDEQEAIFEEISTGSAGFSTANAVFISKP